MRQISHVVLALKVSTVQALLIDTLVSGQLLLRPPSENPVFLNSYTKSAFLHSCKRPVTVTKILSVSRAYPLTRASIASLIFNHLLLLKWRPRKKLDVRDWDKTICVNSVPWVLEISKSVKCFQKTQSFRVYDLSSLWEKTVVQYYAISYTAQKWSKYARI